MMFNKIRRLDTTAVVEHHIVAEAARRQEAERLLHWEVGVIRDLDRRTSTGRTSPSRPAEGLEVEGEAKLELQILEDPTRRSVSIF